MSHRLLIFKLATLVFCLGIGVVLLFTGNRVLGLAHVVVLPVVMWSTIQRLKDAPPPEGERK